MRFKKIAAAAATVVAAAAAVYGAGQAGAIVGGEDVATAPSWMGSLQYDNGDGGFNHGCGASLIAPRWAVTARHCVIEGANSVGIISDTPLDPAMLRVRFGSADRASGGTFVEVAGIERPPRNPIPTVGTDIALLRLAEDVPGQPVPIAPNAGGTGPTRILGWGLTCTGEGCGSPRTLQRLDTRTIADIDCAALAIHFTVESCIGEWNANRGAHFGDSGGPAVRMIDGQWQLTGATSRVMNAGNAPTIYVDVPAWRAWIRETTGIDTL